mgnify:CR=1 FL=1
MNILRLFLLPFSFIYLLVTYIRNVFYDFGIFRSYTSPIPVIALGNLSVGGTGKTPHCEFLLKLVGKSHRVAYLSRGYKRDSKGFLLIEANTPPEQSGDEPLQVKQKFPWAIVAVCRNREKGIHQLLHLFPTLELVILDDAYQHRRVKPAFNVLLTDYRRLFVDDYLLPAGRLRESRLGYRRSDCIVITKTERVLPVILQNHLHNVIKPLSHQLLLYSYYNYSAFKPVCKPELQKHRKKASHIVLFTGIENPLPLVDYLKSLSYTVDSISFPDHHAYNQKDLKKVISLYESKPCVSRMILTTEKDLIRLETSPILKMLDPFPFYYVTIEVVFHDEGEQVLTKKVESLLSDASAKRQLSLFS